MINFWNPGATRIFGFTADEAIGQSLDLIIPPNLRARHWEGFNRVMATGESHYGHGDLLSVPALTKSGQRISVEFTIAMLKDQPRTSGRHSRHPARRQQALRGSARAEAPARGDATAERGDHRTALTGEMPSRPVSRARGWTRSSSV